MMLLRTLLKHYRRHPVQALFLLTGIVVANMLLAGTLLINAQARASYSQGELLLNAAHIGQLRHRDARQMLDERDFVRLRREGHAMVAPLLRQVVRTASGEPLELLGIDVFAMPRGRPSAAGGGLDVTGFSYAPYELWLAPARMEQLKKNDGDHIELASGAALPPLRAVAGQQLGHRMLLDIGALQQATGAAGKLSSILVFPATDERLEALGRAIPPHMEFVRNSDAPDPAVLTRSFHLNLAAMGLLAFVVGLFLMYNALAFSYTDRRELIRKLRLAGLTRAELARGLVSELLLFLLAGTLIGAWLGAQMAAWLLPGVGRTLAQLYGVYIAYPDGLIPSGIWLPLAMTALAAVLCVFFPLRQALDTPMLERWQTSWQQQATLRRDRWLAMAGLFLLAGAVLLGRLATTLPFALAGMACLLLGAALLLPLVLRALLRFFEARTPAQRPRLAWLLADSRWLLGPASLALMAMTLALVANSGLNTMINSFRDATDEWLDQRLAADLYLPGTIDSAAVAHWLSAEAPGVEVSERYRRSLTRLNGAGEPVAIELVSLQDGAPFRDSVRLIRSEPHAGRRFNAGEGVYVSERAWRLDGWQAGDTVQLCAAGGDVPVLGVYHDYGNPSSQWLVSGALFRNCWPEQAASGLSVYGPDGTDWNRMKAAMSQQFGLEDGDIIDQRELKQAGMAVFDRTFTVTQALNALTLLVAGIGIFCAVSAIHHHRIGQQALLFSLGLTRRERGVLLLSQWGLLGLLCMVLVWPFGTLLAGYLAAVVTPVAFGWSFALRPEWGHYLALAALAVSCLVLAVLLPSLGLLRISPAAMLREQTV
jgi:putative ABC transport system permease protein